MAEALGTWREARCEGGREPVPSGAGPAGRASDWLPPLGSGPWAGPRWAGLPLALQAWPGVLRGASLTRSSGPPAAVSPVLSCTARYRRGVRGELPAPRQLRSGSPGHRGAPIPLAVRSRHEPSGSPGCWPMPAPR